MSGARSGAGDPARTLELLWREPLARAGQRGTRAGQRGPKQGLTVERIVAAAIALADAEGVAAVTMRRVAGALGVAAMSLYTYVPGKAELLDLMLDTVYADMPRADLGDRPWRARVAAVAEENRRLYERHPWLADVATSRPPLGPGLMAKYEHELRAFDGMGLADVEVDAALTFVLDFVRGNARAAAELRASQRESALSEEQWWARYAPLLGRVLDAARYPTAARVGTAAGASYGGASSPAYAWEFGLGRVLDGLAALAAAALERRVVP